MHISELNDTKTSSRNSHASAPHRELSTRDRRPASASKTRPSSKTTAATTAQESDMQQKLSRTGGRVARYNFDML